MENLLAVIRNAARAIIIRDGKLLVLKKINGSYTLPGGAQNTGETIEQALQRECLEEINTRVLVNRLAYVGDYFKPKQSTPPAIRHQIEFLFDCRVDEDYIAQSGDHPDKRQVDVVWIDIHDLDKQPLYPLTLKKCIKDLDENKMVYIGVLEHQ